MANMDLGFPEQHDALWLVNRYFPSKVGGRPAWLDLASLPQLECAKCKGPMSFLCQIYAPFDDDQNFHRTLYVFVCRAEGCQAANSAENFVALRSQLPRKNDFYSAEPPVEKGEPLPAIAARQKMCVVCGCLGNKSCGRCKNINYCSAQHQRMHWPNHKKTCTADTNSKKNSTEDISFPEVLFPEWEIVIEPYDSTVDREETDELTRAKNAQEEYDKLAVENKLGELQDTPADELEKYAQSTSEIDDKHFRKFKKEINKDPDQILRYKRGGEPLWIADTKSTFTAEQMNVPKCQHCGGKRNFEFQIMPQLLNLLKDEQLDWGVLSVYTCVQSCAPQNGESYVREHIVKQDVLGEHK